MNDCQRFRDEWVETGAVPPEAAEHAAGCESCRRRLSDHAETWAALGRDAAAEPVPESFRAAVLRRIAAAERGRRKRLRLVVAGSLLTGIAAALLLVASLRQGGDDGVAIAVPPAELLSNLDLYENLEFIESEGEELDWIAAMSIELDDAFLEDRWE